MGRTIPVGEIVSSHPILQVALVITWMGVFVGVISSLCGFWSKKTFCSSYAKENKATKTTTKEQETITTTPTTYQGDADDDGMSRPLPPPPATELSPSTDVSVGLGDKKHFEPTPKVDKSSSLQNYMSKSSSRRKLSLSISMRMSTKTFKDKASEIKDKATDFGKLKHEDSLWTKRIILGEKCKLPNEDDDAILYDEHGNRVGVPTFAQSFKSGATGQSTSRSTGQSMSRSSSFIDHDLKSTASQEDVSKGKEKGKEIQSDADS